MRLDIRIVGQTKHDVRKGLQRFINELKKKNASSNGYIACYLQNGNRIQTDFEWTDCDDVSVDNNQLPIIKPT